MSVIREVYSGLNGAKEQYSVPSLDAQIEDAAVEHEAACHIVDALRKSLDLAIEQTNETRRKLMELRRAAVQQ